MKILFEHQRSTRPIVSIVLIDWSCRESFHILDYLAKQTVERGKYEIIWIEYYDKRAREIDLAIGKCRVLDQEPPLDKWIVLGMPESQYYHNHLMYNAGILVGSGDVVTFCDSDAIVNRTFVGSIIDSFAKDRNIVLHMDQVRNREKRYYPFNYPSIAEVTHHGRTNMVDGKPAGLQDTSDPIHSRNYGACMSALRQDLLAVGGADEHIDYLGYVCGPYEMTWRLKNWGRKEMWHDGEWTYHVWHPGQLGAHNYFGPHDGFHVSSTALSVRQSGRILPLLENPAIEALRRSGQIYSENQIALDAAVSTRDFTQWKVSKIRLGLVSLGKAMMRKFLPQRVKTYLWSRFRGYLNSRSRPLPQ